jgi:hypothetical protein
MILTVLLSSILVLHPSSSFPLRVTGEASAVQKLVDIMNCEAYPALPVEGRLINAETKEYGIRLTRKLDKSGYADRQNRFQCALNYLLGDSTKVFKVQLVENHPYILIAEGRRGVIDIADVEKFDSDPERAFTAFNILLHELYEQYQLQVKGHLQPGRITRAQLNRAHEKATQKESNFYSVMAVRSKADITDEFIHIEFRSRIDSTETHYYAYHRNGNIERVERK